MLAACAVQVKFWLYVPVGNNAAVQYLMALVNVLRSSDASTNH